MSEEQLKAFLNKVEAEISLQQKLTTAASVEALVAIAAELGFSFSSEDLKKAQIALSEEELADIHGGSGSIASFFEKISNDISRTQLEDAQVGI